MTQLKINLLLSRLCSAAVYVCFVAEVKLGAGEHISNPQLLGNLTIISHWTYFHSWILVIGISSVKISVGSFLLRLVQGKWHKASFDQKQKNLSI
jgi:hypothetical protein